MDSSNLDPHVIHDSFGLQESAPNGISIGSALFAQHIRVQHTDTDRQTMVRATSVTKSRIYAMHAMQCNKQQLKQLLN